MSAPDSVEPDASRRMCRPPLPRWTVPVVAGAVLIISCAVLVWLWSWVGSQPWSDPEKKTTALLDVVKVASGIAVGGGGLFALYLAARRQRTQELELAQREEVHAHAVHVAENAQLHAERVALAAEQDASHRRVTELYTKAADQLGSDKAPVRLAGMYALERLAQDNPSQRRTIVNLLCAYLRMPYAVPGARPDVEVSGEDRSTENLRYDEQAQEKEVRLTAQRIIASHLKPVVDSGDSDSVNPEFWGEFDIDLRNAVLIGFDLIECRLGRAIFSGAKFFGRTQFTGTVFGGGAWFNEAVFMDGTAWFGEVEFVEEAFFYKSKFAAGAVFTKSSFSGRATFSGSIFEGSDLLGNALFVKADFEADAQFSNVGFFGGASFRLAKFKGQSVFYEAIFERGAEYAGMADFRGAEFVEGVEFSRARFSKGQVTFADAIFSGHPSFSKAEFDCDTDFEGATFDKGPFMSGVWMRNESGSIHVLPDGWIMNLATSREDAQGQWSSIKERFIS